MGHWLEACEILTGLTAQKDDTSEYLYLDLARACFASGKIEQAHQYLAQLDRSDLSQDQILQFKAEMALFNSEFHKAEEYLVAAINRSPDNLSAHQLLCDLRYQLGTPKFDQEFLTAALASPSNIPLQIAYARLLCQIMGPQHGLDWLNNLFAMETSKLEQNQLNAQKILLLLELGRIEEATRLASEIDLTSHADNDCYLGLGLGLLYVQRPHDLIELFTGHSRSDFWQDQHLISVYMAALAQLGDPNFEIWMHPDHIVRTKQLRSETTQKFLVADKSEAIKIAASDRIQAPVGFDAEKSILLGRYTFYTVPKPIRGLCDPVGQFIHDYITDIDIKEGHPLGMVYEAGNIQIREISYYQIGKSGYFSPPADNDGWLTALLVIGENSATRFRLDTGFFEKTFPEQNDFPSIELDALPGQMILLPVI